MFSNAAFSPNSSFNWSMTASKIIRIMRRKIMIASLYAM